MTTERKRSSEFEVQFPGSFRALLDQAERLRQDFNCAEFAADCEKMVASGQTLRRVGDEWLALGLRSGGTSDNHRYAHDIRTPVNHLIGYSELIEEEGGEALSTSDHEALQRVMAAARRFLKVLELREGERSPAPEKASNVEPMPQPVATGVDQIETSSEAGKIMVVDDDPLNREIVIRKLTSLGHELIEAEGGRIAIELAAKEPVDLILLDMMMPDLDGLTTARQLKRLPRSKETPIIFMTGSNREETLPKAFRAGVVDYLSKPLKHEEMLARVNTHLRISRLTRSLAAKNLELEAEINRRTEAERNLTLVSEEMDQRFCAGGTLRHDAPSYVEREADRLLQFHILQRTLTYVFTSRQMGKSSLMARTSSTIRDKGIRVATLDLTAIGQNLNAEQWYDGLVSRLGWQLKMEDEVEDFWLDHGRLSSVQRFFLTLRKIILPHKPTPLVIFIDEIDAVKSLPFSTDEFFAAIRETVNRRMEDPEFEKLSFCILGVAAPRSLMRDSRLTPFDLGVRIILGDFHEEEMTRLGLGLNRDKSVAKRLIARIYHWTHGHPYLTQRLCGLVLKQPGVETDSELDALCRSYFVQAGAREEDDNLVFVRQSILLGETQLKNRMLLYSRIRNGEVVPVSADNALLHELELAGLVRFEEGRAVVRNRIYERVFNSEWVDRVLDERDGKPRRSP